MSETEASIDVAVEHNADETSAEEHQEESTHEAEASENDAEVPIQEELAHQKAKVADLESQLKATNTDLMILKEAFANLLARINSGENVSSHVPSSSPSSPPSDEEKKSHSLSVAKVPVKSSTLPRAKTTSPAPSTKPVTTPTSSKTAKTPTSATRSAASVSTGSPVVKPAAPAATKSLPTKIPAAADAKKKDDKKDDEKRQKLSYAIGKRKIFFYLPQSYADKDVKKIPSNLTTTLSIDFAYGYSGQISQNLYYNEQGKLVYVLAGMGIVYDHEKKEQKQYLGHNDDLKSCAVHPNKKYFATGQIDPKGKQKPFVSVWDSTTLKEVNRIAEFHDRAVIALAFSPDGKYLVSVGDDDSHLMALWRWEEKQREPLTSVMVSKAEVLGVVFNMFRDEKDNTTLEEEKKDKLDGVLKYEILAFGAKQVKFLNVIYNEETSQFSVSSQIPTYQTQTKTIQKSFTCAVWVDKSNCVVGTESGPLYVFKNHKFEKQLKGHDKQVGGIALISDGFASVGYDGKLRLHTLDMKEKAVIDLPNNLACSNIAMFQSADAKIKLAIGAYNNCIYEVSLDTNKIEHVMSGHRGEIWGLAVHPQKPVIITGASDSVRFWDFSKHAPIFDKVVDTIKSAVACAAFHPSGATFSVGLQDGSVHIYDTETLEKKFGKKIHTERVDSLNYSPDGKYLASGSWDQTIQLVDTVKLSPVIQFKGHTSSVQHVTFTADGKFLISNSKDGDILNWIIPSGKRATKEAEVVDADFYNWINVLGWPVVGIFQEAGDITDVNTAHVSGDSKSEYRVIATGDDNQMVNLYRFPALQKDAPKKTFGGHSSHVTRVRFSPDSSLLFSVGGMDGSVIQWKHVAAVADTQKYADT